MKSVIRTAVFDLDGTLVRTEAIAAQMLEEALARRGVRLAPEDRNVAVGRTWGRDGSAYPEVFAGGGPTRFYGGCFRFVPRPYQSRSRSGPRRRRVRPRAGGFDASCIGIGILAEEMNHPSRARNFGMLSVFLGAEDYPKSKPAPDGYQKAFRQLGVQGSPSI